MLTAKACFAAPLPTKLPRNKRDVAFKGTHPDLRLKAGSPAIDRGIVIPNIVENCNGKAPDLGALEHGAPLPHWGPRDEAE